MEAKLAGTEINKRVYNLGVPGTDTLFHIGVAGAYVESFKSAVVILSILIADDLQQVYESANLEKRGIKATLLSNLRKWFPGIDRMLKAIRNAAARTKPNEHPETIEVTKSWAKDAQRIIADNNLRIPRDVEALAANGGINPGLFSLAAKYPDRSWRFWEHLDVKGSKEGEVFNVIRDRLGELNKIVKSNGGRLVILSMPSGAFVKSKVSQNYVKYGLNIRPSNFQSITPEVVLGRLAETIKSEFVPLLQAFRSGGSDYFYEYDGHLNSNGNRLVADKLAEYFLSGSKREP